MLEFAEKLIAAARLAFDGTAMDLAFLLERDARKLVERWRKGRVPTQDEMRRIDAITAISGQLQADMATARRAGLRVVREEGVQR